MVSNDNEETFAGAPGEMREEDLSEAFDRRSFTLSSRLVRAGDLEYVERTVSW